MGLVNHTGKNRGYDNQPIYDQQRLVRSQLYASQGMTDLLQERTAMIVGRGLKMSRRSRYGGFK